MNPTRRGFFRCAAAAVTAVAVAPVVEQIAASVPAAEASAALRAVEFPASPAALGGYVLYTRQPIPIHAYQGSSYHEVLTRLDGAMEGNITNLRRATRLPGESYADLAASFDRVFATLPEPADPLPLVLCAVPETDLA